MSKQVTLENTLAGGFGLPTGQVVPGNGSILVEPEVWAAAKDHPVVAARVKAGTIIVDGQGKKAAEALVGEAIQARVTELEALLKAANDEIVKLKAGSGGDNGTDVNSTAEALALFTTDGVHANTAKAKAKAFLGDKVKADASKDDILAALIGDASDTELKTFLTAKGVAVKDETRDDLIKLAQAA